MTLNPVIPIIQVIHKFDRRAGPDLLVAELLHKLDRSRWSPNVFMLDFGLFDGPSLLEQTMPQDVPLHIAPWGGGKGLPAAIRAFQSLRTQTKAQVIHSHDIPSHLVSAPLFARTGPARVASLHGIVDQTKRQRQWNALMRRLLARIDHTIVSSDYVRQNVPTLPDNRVTMLMNAIDVQAITPRDAAPLARAHSTNDPLRLLCVARLSEEKGHAHLINAMSRLTDMPVHLDILGTGPMSDQIIALAEPVSNVTVHGFVEDAVGFFQRADIFALASIRESLSIGVLEAMAHGLPVLTTDVGAHPNVVGDSGSGWIAPRENPQALEAAIRDALRNPDKLPIMAKNGHTHVHAAHSMEHFVSETARIYDAALNR
ncbi:MAG: glycosyltransferase family 4 protein [Paracoccaceae bacterium]